MGGIWEPTTMKSLVHPSQTGYALAQEAIVNYELVTRKVIPAITLPSPPGDTTSATTFGRPWQLVLRHSCAPWPVELRLVSAWLLAG